MGCGVGAAPRPFGVPLHVRHLGDAPHSPRLPGEAPKPHHSAQIWPISPKPAGVDPERHLGDARVHPPPDPSKTSRGPAKAEPLLSAYL